MDAFPETIPDLREARAARAGGRARRFFEGEPWTLRDGVGEVGRVAVGLAERGGGQGDRVALVRGNRPRVAKPLLR